MGVAQQLLASPMTGLFTVVEHITPWDERHIYSIHEWLFFFNGELVGINIHFFHGSYG